MPSSGFFSDSGSAIVALSAPRDKWERKYQQKQLDQQYLNLQEARATNEAKEVEQTVQKQIANVNALKAMPVEAPDRPKTDAYINSLINDTIKNIKTNYNDDYAKFLLNEGESTIMQMRDSYLSSGAYATSTRNKMEMDLARKAIQDNHSLIGSMDKDGNYVSAEQAITDFQEGKVDGFRFRGAYDASKIKPYEYFGKTYNPGGSKFVPSSVSESDKLAFAQSAAGAEAGLDYYHKALKGRKIQYKTDQIEDLEMFNLDKDNKEASIAQKNASTANSYANAEKLKAEAAEKKDPVKNASYFDTQIRQNVGVVSATGYNPTSPVAKTVIKNLGVPVSDLATASVGGKATINMIKKPNLRGEEYANQALGISVGSKNGSPVYSGRLNEIILLDKGGIPYDISGMGQGIASTEPFISVDQNEDQRSALENRRPSRAFKKFEVLVYKKDFDAKYPDAENPGPVVKNKGDSSKDRYKIVGYTPIPNWYQMKEVDQDITKRQIGQKAANEIGVGMPEVEIPTFDD